MVKSTVFNANAAGAVYAASSGKIYGERRCFSLSNFVATEYYSMLCLYHYEPQTTP